MYACLEGEVKISGWTERTSLRSTTDL